MKVRATRFFHYLGKTWREGDVISLNQDQGIHLLRAGSVEPLVDLEPFRPPLDTNGLTLREAYLLHVRGFPPLKPLLDEPQLQRQGGRLRVRLFAGLPKWPGLPPAQSKRLTRPDSSFVRRGLVWDDTLRVGLAPHDPWSKSGPSLEVRYRKALSDYLRCAAIHYFFKRLADHELEAVGVSESDLNTLKETKIPAGWWRRDIVLDLGRNEMWELMGPKPEQLVRRYSEICIREPTASQKQGQGGRPSHRKELLRAVGELWDNGSLTKEDLKNKKGVWNKVLKHLEISPHASGCSYNSFVQHVGPLIDKILQTRDSEN